MFKHRRRKTNRTHYISNQNDELSYRYRRSVLMYAAGSHTVCRVQINDNSQWTFSLFSTNNVRFHKFTALYGENVYIWVSIASVRSTNKIPSASMWFRGFETGLSFNLSTGSSISIISSPAHNLLDSYQRVIVSRVRVCTPSLIFACFPVLRENRSGLNQAGRKLRSFLAAHSIVYTYNIPPLPKWLQQLQLTAENC